MSGNARLVFAAAASFAAGTALAVAVIVFYRPGRIAFLSAPTSEPKRKFAELAHQLSLDQSALDKECRDRRSTLSSARLMGLRALPGAEPIVARFEQEIAKAKNAKEVAMARAEAERAQKEHDLTFERSEKISQIERDQQAADRQTLSERDEALRAAKQRRDAGIAEIHKLPFSEQSGPLREAEAAYAQEVSDARAAYERKAQQNRDVMQSKERQAVADEAAGVAARRIRPTAPSRWPNKSIDAELKAADLRQLQALSALTGAANINATFERQRATIDRECNDRLNRLLAEFRKQKQALGIPDHALPAAPVSR